MSTPNPEAPAAAAGPKKTPAAAASAAAPQAGGPAKKGGSGTATPAKSPAAEGAGSKSPQPAAEGKTKAPAAASTKSPQPAAAGKGKAPAGGGAAPKAPANTEGAAKAPAAAGTAKAPAEGAEGVKSPRPAGAGKSKAPAGAGGAKKSSKSPQAAGTGAKAPADPASAGGAKSPQPAGGNKSPQSATGAKSPQPASGAKSPQPAGGAKAPATTAGSKSATPEAPASSASSVRGVATPSAVTAQPAETERETALTANATVAPSSQPPVPPASSAAGASDMSAVNRTALNASEVEPQYSPIPRANTTGNLSATNASMSPRRRAPAPPAAQRKPMEPLTVDPRSGLPLIDIPRDRQHSFAHLGNDLLLHIFVDVDRISSRGTPLRRVLLITDQTLFVCEERGGVLRCVQVSKISQVSVATDNSNAIAVSVPSEYDLILRMDQRRQRDDVLIALRAVYRRMTDSELNVNMVKEIRANQYRMEKPPGFQLVRIPQRSKAHLAKAIEAIQVQEDERRQAVEAVQSQLAEVHFSELENKKAEAASVRAKLDEANTRLRQQQEELERLRVAYSKCKKRVEEIDLQRGPNGEMPAGKDDKIRELNEIVEALTNSVAKVNEERARLEAKKRQGDFEELEPDEVEMDHPRFRGRSLHQQGLIEILQRQLVAKQRELAELQTKQLDIQRLDLELRAKDDQLKELENLVQLPPDPMMLYSNAPGASARELLDSAGMQYSPPRNGYANAPGAAGVHVDPSFALDQSSYIVSRDHKVDEDGEAMLEKGKLPVGRVNVSAIHTPEYQVPSEEKDFKVDPRTRLKFYEIPQGMQDAFKELKDSIIHFFAVGNKLNKRGREQARVILCSDQTIYQCNKSGHINRCIWITSVREVIMDSTSIALWIDGKDEYDVAFVFERPAVCEELNNVLREVNRFLKRDPPMKTTRVDKINAAELKLEKPPTWEFKLHPIRKKRNLHRSLLELNRASAEERAKLHAAADQYTVNIIERIKKEMRPEITQRKEREFAVLRQQAMLLDKTVREKQLEVRNLRREMMEHRCTVGPKVIKRSDPMEDESKGMYWIPTDPVIMEADQDVLHIQFHENYVVTSHGNGFLCVWDITSAQLSRTLRNGGHTARVQAFWYDGKDLISGGYDSCLKRWSVAEGACIKTIFNAHKGHVTVVKFDLAHLFSAGSDGVIHVWDITSLKLEKSLRAHKSAVTCFALTDHILASAEWGWIFVWDIDKGIVTKALRDDNGGIHALDLRDARLLTGGTGGVLTVWDLRTGEGEQLDGHTDDIHHVQIQGEFAITSSADCSIRMWNLRERTFLGVFHNSYPNECKSFYFLHNRFVVGEGKIIKCWTR